MGLNSSLYNAPPDKPIQYLSADFILDSGWNANYHPRDSSSGDGESMEPAWWRSGWSLSLEYKEPTDSFDGM